MSTLPLGQHGLSLAAGLARLDPRTESASARVSSGRRIDRPAVDSAGLGQAAKLESEQGRLRAVEVNIQNGVSRLQVTNGQLGLLSRAVTRLSELSALAANATQSPSERALYSTEFTQIQEQLRLTIGGTTAQIGGKGDVPSPLGEFNGRELFGPGPGDILPIGAQSGEQLTLPVLNFRSGPLADLIRQDASGAFTFTLGTDSTPKLTAALSQISDAQTEVGASQSRLNFAAGVATTASANHEAALASIQDADLAAEATNLARLQILTESHTAMLAQARDVTAKLIPLLSRN